MSIIYDGTQVGSANRAAGALSRVPVSEAL